jgi:hypothetical protein
MDMNELAKDGRIEIVDGSDPVSVAISCLRVLTSTVSPRESAAIGMLITRLSLIAAANDATLTEARKESIVNDVFDDCDSLTKKVTRRMIETHDSGSCGCSEEDRAKHQAIVDDAKRNLDAIDHLERESSSRAVSRMNSDPIGDTDDRQWRAMFRRLTPDATKH